MLNQTISSETTCLPATAFSKYKELCFSVGFPCMELEMFPKVFHIYSSGLFNEK